MSKLVITLRVTRHEASVNIRLLAQCTARLNPDLFAEVNQGMNKSSYTIMNTETNGGEVCVTHQ